MNNSKSCICFGEILWDVFPHKVAIGGAPFNVAMRLHVLGAHSAIISSVGKDAMGTQAMEFINEQEFPTEGIQIHPNLSTGQVIVQLDEQRNATYDIVQPVAWDEIKITSTSLDIVSNASLFIFGSLAARSEVSRNSLLALISNASYKVFDVNFRAPHYTYERIIELLKVADFVKMNDDELVELVIHLGYGNQSLKEHAQKLKDAFSLEFLCVTRGSYGALLVHKNGIYEAEGFSVTVVDTVGAGDSFLACLLFELFQIERHPQLALQRACAMGALVASKNGANCEVSEEEIRGLMKRKP